MWFKFLWIHKIGDVEEGHWAVLVVLVHALYSLWSHNKFYVISSQSCNWASTPRGAWTVTDGSPFLDSHFPSLWLPATTPEQKTPELQFSTTLSGGGRGIQVGIKNVIFLRACATPTCNCAATCCMFLHCGGASIHGKWHHPLPCHLGCGFSCFGGCFGLEFGKSAASLLKKKYGKDEAV
jgi:hypothetical protein